MNDEPFRLTPADIRAQPFRRALFGYDRVGVEEFRAQVIDALERLLRERATLEERLANFRDQLKAYRDREKAINDAVMMAQQLRKDTEDNVRRESQVTLGDARKKADDILVEARAAEERIRGDVETAQRQFSAYLAAFRQLLWRQLAELDALEEHERDGTAPRAGEKGKAG